MCIHVQDTFSVVPGVPAVRDYATYVKWLEPNAATAGDHVGHGKTCPQHRLQSVQARVSVYFLRVSCDFVNCLISILHAQVVATLVPFAMATLRFMGYCPRMVTSHCIDNGIGIRLLKKATHSGQNRFLMRVAPMCRL
jgi:hypothetical protein